MIPFFESRKKQMVANKTNKVSFPPHVHTDLELLYVEQGGVFVEIDGVSYSLERGDLAMIFPGCIHSYYSERNDCKNVFCLIIAPAEFSGTYMNSMQKCRPLMPVVRKKFITEEIEYVISHLLHERDCGNDTVIYISYMQILLTRAWPALNIEHSPAAPTPDLTCRVINYVRDNITKPFTLEEMAFNLGAGKCKISRIFSDKLNMSFNDYTNSIRISLATNMLASTRSTVTDIAYECGFESLRTFNRAFKKFIGMAPREYRKSIDAGNVNPKN